jgi:hypothetical protein
MAPESAREFKFMQIRLGRKCIQYQVAGAIGVIARLLRVTAEMVPISDALATY